MAPTDPHARPQPPAPHAPIVIVYLPGEHPAMYIAECRACRFHTTKPRATPAEAKADFALHLRGP